MRSLRSWLPLLVLAPLAVACATSVNTGPADPVTEKDPTEGADDDKIPGQAEAPAHALATITLGEARASRTGDSRTIISASFVPDAKLAKSCTKKVAGCEVTEVPTCTTGTTKGCGTGEACTFDASCTAKCVKVCTKVCSASEECTVTGTPTSTDPEAGMTCKKRERFDGGAIAFSGTTTAITLFPPYAVTPDGNGAPFMAKSEIRAQSTGATKVGFEKFDEKFFATTFLETDPPLADLSRATVFGTGDVDLGWVPGEDTVNVVATGPLGSAKCAADDKSGRFALPRQVIREVLGDSATASSSGLTISVSRERREVRKDKKTIGSLSGGQTVQPTGWLELVTSSTETNSFAGCSTGQTMCGEACVVTSSDPKNCGACGKACLASQYCSSGVCR